MPRILSLKNGLIAFINEDVSFLLHKGVAMVDGYEIKKSHGNICWLEEASIVSDS